MLTRVAHHTVCCPPNADALVPAVSRVERRRPGDMSVRNLAINLTVVVKKPKISCGSVFVKHLHTQTKLVGEN